MGNMPIPTPSTTNSSNGQSPDTNQFRVVRKRNRVPLSCAPCRHRKLKCNRGHPCDNCTKRGDSSSCSYAAPSSRKKGHGGAGPLGTPDDMQNRIDRLESLVLSLMTNGAQDPGTAAAQAAITSVRSNSVGESSHNQSLMEADGESMIRERDGDDSDVNDVSQSLGIMKVDGAKTMYASDSHWYTILADIAEVKNYFASHQQQLQDQYKRVQALKEDDAPGATFLFRAPRLNDRTEALAPFPTKAATDRLVTRYFNSYDPSVHIIHGPTFQIQYDRHWQNPNETPIVFIGMLYAIMALALQSYHRANDEPPEYRGQSPQLSVAFRRLTAQCLILADIKEPVPQIIETLALHLQAEYARSQDAETGILVLVSLMVRLAMRMGYHRDPGPHPNVTPFQGEMRRRVWTIIRQADLLFSFQFGMPSIARSDCIDTQIPRNLYDDELYEDMATLPASRPDSEATPMSYMIAKARLASLFGRIVDRVSAVTNTPSYEEILELDAQLIEARGQTPRHLQLKPMNESTGDTANLIMQRIGLELLFLKSRLVLHRRFVARGRESQRFAFSRRSCIDASLDMLAHQATLHHGSQPNGRLYSIKWYISSLTTHDFLLAAMVVCLDLYHCYESERTGIKPSPSSPVNTDIWADDRKEQMMDALRQCVIICESQRDRSMEAYKASSMLKVMVEKLMANQARQGAQSAYSNVDNLNAKPLNRGNFMFPNGQVNMADDQIAPEHSAAMTLGMLSCGGVSPFGASNGGAGNAGPAGNAVPQGPESRSYPASMAGILNEPLMEGRTGLTPHPEQSGAANAPSPFSSLFSNGMDVSGADIDWGAWDSYVQGSSLEPISMWPPMDFTQLDPQLQQQGQQQQQQALQAQAQMQAQSGAPSQGSSGVFMGATTPNTGNMM